MKKIAVVGLGYVGLPLAVAFGKQVATIGFDLDQHKLDNYRKGIDPTGEVSADALNAAAQLEFTSDPARLAEAEAIIVAVPTPIDEARRPDLGPLEGASRTVGANLSPGTIVIFESTVYPGCTEEVCIPILEQQSGLAWLGGPNADGHAGKPGFFVGYSPERINPGDKVHRLETIVKVVAGDTPQTTDSVASLYERVVDAGVHRAASLKVAEAAKVIENTQRDLNIALMNELALIFHKLDIDTLDVLEAAGSKWNFLPFRPGLVGGHCIGVDPYYLTYKAEAAGHHPQVILAGRQINDGMGKYIAEQTVKGLIKNNRKVNGAKVIVLGLTFKEDCPDLRNSRVIDIIHELETYCCDVSVHDPLADGDEALAEYGVELVDWERLPQADAVVLAVAHQAYKSRTVEDFSRLLVSDGLLIDIKSVLDREAYSGTSLQLWRL
ncbi:MAG: nucleotide sugar dehydrogenase [Gammaproteobacteria bacterium]|nr:nucleotide sugar dehydrogenase [Gammaproteobacteria bacterium]MBQ0838620.1 nucleotide sugar dehydrogenase [Gammaproteobacteria bacterium]